MKIIDQIDRELYFQETPIRIVSLVPSLTELLFDLGLESSIVGITKFCVHPNHAKQTKTIVGGTKNIKIEKIKELNPDIILCNKEENTKEIVEECSKITATHVSDIYTIQDSLDLIEQYGTIFGCRLESKSIQDKIEFKKNQFLDFMKGKSKLKVAYFIWKNPWMAAGNNTFINHLLELNNFENIFAEINRYPEVDLKKVKAENVPDFVLLSSEPYPFNEKHILEIGKFFNKSKLILVDGEMFSWYGSRLIKAFDYFTLLRERI